MRRIFVVLTGWPKTPEPLEALSTGGISAGALGNFDFCRLGDQAIEARIPMERFQVGVLFYSDVGAVKGNEAVVDCISNQRERLVTIAFPRPQCSRGCRWTEASPDAWDQRPGDRYPAPGGIMFPLLRSDPHV